MKTLLYTGFDDPYESLAGITVPRMMEYANRHGMDFTCHHSHPLINVPNGIYWTGVCGALKAFKDGYGRAIYLDVDQLVTNMESELPDWSHGFHASKDWGSDAVEPWHFSMCGFVTHAHTAPFLQGVLGMEPEWRDKPFPEQGPFQHYIKTTLEDQPLVEAMITDGVKLAMNGCFNIHPRKVFNCVPDQVCPGAVPEPWAPGDWCAHLTMVDLPRRIQIAKEILGKL